MKHTAPAYDDSAPPSFRGPAPKRFHIDIRDRCYSRSPSTSPAKATTADQLCDHLMYHVRMPHERPKSLQKREFLLAQEKKMKNNNPSRCLRLLLRLGFPFYNAVSLYYLLILCSLF
ncbi:hypothetical protein Aduo_013695 [Ancylostoma duodenale]